MSRLSFRLPESTRWQWASSATRATWEPRVAAIVAAWQQVEFMSVVHGVRPAAILHCLPEELTAITAQAFKHDLVAAPVYRSAGGTYRSETADPLPGEPFTYRTVISSYDIAKQWGLIASDEQFGKWLGYPKCCRDFFQRCWTHEKWIDLTGPQADNSESPDGPIACNLLLRWLGVRLVPHLACAYDCEATDDFAARLSYIWVEHGYTEEFAWAQEMLSWPVEWSSLHGVAEITTPVVKITTTTDPLSHVKRVRRTGLIYPEKAPEGMKFPFQGSPVRPPTPSSIRAYLNGFSTLEAMRHAHHAVAQTFENSGLKPEIIFDLGCGDGTLVNLLTSANGSIPMGVDLDKEAISAAEHSYPDGVWYSGDLAEVDWPDDALLVLTPSRLMDYSWGRRKDLLARLVGRTVLVYTYLDDQDLFTMCSEAGLTWNPEGRKTTHSGICQSAMIDVLGGTDNVWTAQG